MAAPSKEGAMGRGCRRAVTVTSCFQVFPVDGSEHNLYFSSFFRLLVSTDRLFRTFRFVSVLLLLALLRSLHKRLVLVKASPSSSPLPPCPLSPGCAHPQELRRLLQGGSGGVGV